MNALRSPELVQIICSYQLGFNQDILPFCGCPVVDQRTLTYAIRTETLSLDLNGLRQYFEPWYSEYGTKRLGLLILSLPHLIETALVDAIGSGNCDAVSILLSLKPEFVLSNVLIGIAAASGHLNILQCLHKHNSPHWTAQIMDWAARYGHLDCVCWLHENRTEGCTLEAMNQAANNGHLKVLDWLFKNRKEGCSSHGMDLAASSGHLNIMEWFQFYTIHGCSPNSVLWAATNGHLHAIKWLLVNYPQHFEGTNAIQYAAEMGHLEVVKYLFHNAPHCDLYPALNKAIKGDQDSKQIEIANWLLGHMEYPFVELLRRAKQSHHLDLYKYLRSLRQTGQIPHRHNTNSSN